MKTLRHLRFAIATTLALWPVVAKAESGPADGNGSHDHSKLQELPSELPYAEGAPTPPGYHLDTRFRPGLVVAGGVVLGASYGFALIQAASSKGEAPWLYAPVVGPFVVAGAVYRSSNGQDGAALSLVLIAEGLVQLTGASLLVAGLVSPRTTLVRNDVAKSGGSGFSWVLTPQLGRGSLGLGLAGTM